MPKKSDRRVPLPAGLIPLLTQLELETYYQVSDWTVLRWIEDGMPVRRLKTTGRHKEIRRFDLAEVDAWMAKQEQLAATA